MSLLHHRPNFLVQYFPDGKETRLPTLLPWDGSSLLKLDHPTRFVVQPKEDQIWVRDFIRQDGVKRPATVYQFEPKKMEVGRAGPDLLLADGERSTIRIIPLKAIQPVNETLALSTPRIVLPPIKNPLADDVFYQKTLNKIMGAAFVFALLMQLIRPSAPDTQTEEELIPKKYAKLLLTKPTNTQNNPASGSASSAGASAKTVAKAMQTKSAQQTLRSILKGGLSKYSLMATGKSIQSLNQSLALQTTANMNSLQNKANNALLANQSGAVQVGKGSGYSVGSGVNVSGQGQGSAEVGLNTADAQVDEGLTKEEVFKVIQSHLSEIRFCYESQLVKDATLGGKVIIDWNINPRGLVDNAKTGEATMNNPEVGRCLSSKIKQWKFPTPRGGKFVAVSYPFVFKSLSR
jgi:hypothetical protein